MAQVEDRGEDSRQDGSASQRSDNPSLSTFDAAAITAGIVIGPGIFEIGPIVARGAADLSSLVTIWLLGGLLSFAGILCYAELIQRYPANAGEYVWLQKTFHPRLANTFLWSEIAIIRPGAIAAMAFPAATYLHASVPIISFSPTSTAACIVLVMTVINLFGYRASRLSQNLLTAVKVVALCVIILVGLLLAPSGDALASQQSQETSPDYGLALILVLFTFGGWNEIANVAGHVHGGARSVYKASIVALAIITAIYVLTTIAYVNLLGLSRYGASRLPVVEGLQEALSYDAAQIVSSLIAVSCLGAIQGMIFSGAPLYSKFIATRTRAQDTSAESASSPYILQLCLSVAIIYIAQSFSTAVVYTTTVVWLCFLLRGLCVPILRAKYGPPAVLATPWYPIPVLIFCASCVFLIWSAYLYSPGGTAISLAISAIGLVVLPHSDSK